MGYATIEQTHRTDVNVTSETKVLQSFKRGQNAGCILQTTITTTETWQGLSLEDARSLLTSSMTSTLNGETRNFLGGAKLVLTTPISSYWAIVDACWGTVVQTNISRMGDTHLYQVQRTTQEMTASSGGQGTFTLL